MNKNAIQKFAIWARNELIAQVSQRAYQYGIDASGFGDASADTLNGRPLTAEEKSQRQGLIKQIKEKGYQQVMEAVAYTWFNRFIALRFMEVNNYLPSHIRVFSDASGAFKPEILNDVLHLDLPGLDSGKVAEYIESNDTEGLYRYLLLTQCNALNSALPVMFERMGGYTEMLLPNNILRQDSVLGHMVSDIPEENWQDAVQIIGWLYQYYNTELKDDTFAQLKKNVKITKERIPAATQLFTPDWIVRYMVENSLGRLWLEGHPNAALHGGWKYYLDEAEQEPEVEAQLAKLREEYKTIKPEEIKVIDPCMGSGHILVYAFDVLMQIYTAAGWDQREAAQSILKNNLYGLDIDDRAAQLAYFAVMMKARQYDRRLFTREIQPHVYAIAESGHTDKDGKWHKNYDEYTLAYFCNGDAKLKKAMDTIISQLHDAKEYGSILTVTPQDWSALYARFAEIKEDIHISREAALRGLLPLVQTAQALAQKYDVVVTNPPYMSSSGMGDSLLLYVKSEYPDERYDLSTVMMSRCLHFASNTGLVSMINIPVWMFISSYTELREKLIKNNTILNMLHLGRGVFGSDFGTTAFVISKSNIPDYFAVYRKLHTEVGNVDSIEQKEKWFFEGFGYYTSQKQWYTCIPTTPIAYWLSENAINLFSTKPALRNIADPRQGLATGNDELFLRQWQEVDYSRIGFGYKDTESFQENADYAPFNKGGAFRKWYGNNTFVIRFSKENYNLLLKSGNHLPSRQFYFKPGITWTALTAGDFSGRYCSDGFVFAGKGPMCFPNRCEDIYYLLGFLNSRLTNYFMKVFSSTTDFNQGPMRDLPLMMSEAQKREQIESIVKDNILISNADWDSYETSWDFKRNPLV